MLQFDHSRHTFLKDGQEVALASDDKKTIEHSNWWYRVPFASGVSTGGKSDQPAHLGRYLLHRLDLKGKSVLDLACRDGFFLWYCEAYGATRLTGMNIVSAKRDYSESFACARRLLGSRAELVVHHEIEQVGQSDIVLLIDCLNFSRDPYSVLKKACAAAKEKLVIFSTVTAASDPVPRQIFHPQYDGGGDEYQRSMMNPAWIVYALDELGFAVCKTSSLMEDGRIGIIAERKTSDEKYPLQGFESLPSDEGMEGDTAILVMSCKKFEQCWEPFFTLFKRYWPDCPYQVHFCTDKGTYPGVDTIEIGEDLGWTSNCLTALKRLRTSRVILFQEDFLITGQVDTTKIRKLIQHSRAFEIACLRLEATPGPATAWYASDVLGTLAPQDEYRFSLQLSIWKRNFLCEILKADRSPWQLETEGTKEMALRPEPIVGVWPEPARIIPYYVTGIVKGEWEQGAIDLLKKEGIPTDHIRRKIQ